MAAGGGHATIMVIAKAIDMDTVAGTTRATAPDTAPATAKQIIIIYIVPHVTMREWLRAGRPIVIAHEPRPIVPITYMPIVVVMSIAKPTKVGSPMAARAGNPRAPIPGRIPSSLTEVARHVVMVQAGTKVTAELVDQVAVVGEVVVAEAGARI